MSERLSDHSEVHPDCQNTRPHQPHELASPGGAKPWGSWCTGISDPGTDPPVTADHTPERLSAEEREALMDALSAPSHKREWFVIDAAQDILAAHTAALRAECDEWQRTAEEAMADASLHYTALTEAREQAAQVEALLPTGRHLLCGTYSIGRWDLAQEVRAVLHPGRRPGEDERMSEEEAVAAIIRQAIHNSHDLTYRFPGDVEDHVARVTRLVLTARSPR